MTFERVTSNSLLLFLIGCSIFGISLILPKLLANYDLFNKTEKTVVSRGPFNINSLFLDSSIDKSSRIYQFEYPTRAKANHATKAILKFSRSVYRDSILKKMKVRLTGIGFETSPSNFIHVPHDLKLSWIIRPKKPGIGYLELAFIDKHINEETKVNLPDTTIPQRYQVTITGPSGLSPTVQYWMRVAGAVIAFIFSVPIITELFKSGKN